MIRLLFALTSLLSFALLTKGRLITCVCTTKHCQEQQTRTCNTTSMCFSQYLDRRDGTDPVVKGCITSKTPLLCENRRPAVHPASWPVLLCCNKDMCNLDVQPTPSGSQNEITGQKMDQMTTVTEVYDSPSVRAEDPLSGQPADEQHTLSAVYISVVVAGILCLLVIGAIAILVLRRQSAMYSEEFGTVQSNGYLKGQSTEIHAVEVHRSAPIILGKTYDNKLVLNT